MRHLVCNSPQCKTVLSRFNPGPTCWMHLPDLTQTVTAQQAQQLRPRTSIMSDEFIRGVAGTYRFTSDERANYKRGAW